MRVVITASKNFDDYDTLETKLPKLFSAMREKPTLVIAKGDGAAHLVETFAFKEKYVVEVHRPDKKKNSFAEVTVMHEEMLAGAKHVVAFLCRSGNEDSEDLIVRAKKHGAKVRAIREK
jgi:hypothetical protein